MFGALERVGLPFCQLPRRWVSCLGMLLWHGTEALSSASPDSERPSAMSLVEFEAASEVHEVFRLTRRLASLYTTLEQGEHGQRAPDTSSEDPGDDMRSGRGTRAGGPYEERGTTLGPEIQPPCHRRRAGKRQIRAARRAPGSSLVERCFVRDMCLRGVRVAGCCAPVFPRQREIFAGSFSYSGG